MAGSGQVLQRQSGRTRFKNADMDFALNWTLGIGQIVGMSPGEVFAVVDAIEDGDPASWRAAFARHADHLRERTRELRDRGNLPAAGHSAFGSAYASRAALQFCDPTDTVAWNAAVRRMEESFQEAVDLLEVPLDPITVPFDSRVLPGYHLEVDDRPRPTVVTIGGGDTFREDLYYFAGHPGWHRGYNVLMVDLPGQGNTPASGLTFRHDAAPAIGACLDWLTEHASAPDERIALYGLSGGGYFTAQAAATDDRVRAWIASTPITDIGSVFERELGAASSAPGWLLDFAVRALGRVNEVLAVTSRKYAWQFGTADFTEAASRVRAEATAVDPSTVVCPALFLLGEGEAPELKRQTRSAASTLRAAGRDVTVETFTRADGDAHCQVTNLRLAHLILFDWLDRTLRPS